MNHKKGSEFEKQQEPKLAQKQNNKCLKMRNNIKNGAKMSKK